MPNNVPMAGDLSTAPYGRSRSASDHRAARLRPPAGKLGPLAVRRCACLSAFPRFVSGPIHELPLHGMWESGLDRESPVSPFDIGIRRPWRRCMQRLYELISSEAEMRRYPGGASLHGPGRVCGRRGGQRVLPQQDPRPHAQQRRAAFRRVSGWIGNAVCMWGEFVTIPMHICARPEPLGVGASSNQSRSEFIRDGQALFRLGSDDINPIPYPLFPVRERP